MGNRLFQRVKVPRCGGDHPHPLAPTLKKKYNHTSTPLKALMACSSMSFTSYLYLYFIFNAVPLYY
jgi:hypothetical protein